MACGPPGSVADPISALTFKDKSVSSRVEVCDQVQPNASGFSYHPETADDGDGPALIVVEEQILIVPDT